MGDSGGARCWMMDETKKDWEKMLVCKSGGMKGGQWLGSVSQNTGGRRRICEISGEF